MINRHFTMTDPSESLKTKHCEYRKKHFTLSVRFRNEKVRINCETVWVFSPGLTDHLERSSPAQSLKVSGEVVSQHESQNVGFQRIKIGIMKRLNRSFFYRSIHSLDLAVSPRIGNGCITLVANQSIRLSNVFK